MFHVRAKYHKILVESIYPISFLVCCILYFPVSHLIQQYMSTAHYCRGDDCHNAAGHRIDITPVLLQQKLLTVAAGALQGLESPPC